MHDIAKKRRFSLKNRRFLDDQGAFASLKENLRFSEPLQGSRPDAMTKQKTSTRIPFILVDDQGLEAGLRSQKRGFFKEKSRKNARFESHAPIMPQNAPWNPGCITCCS